MENPLSFMEFLQTLHSLPWADLGKTLWTCSCLQVEMIFHISNFSIFREIYICCIFLVRASSYYYILTTIISGLLTIYNQMKNSSYKNE